MARILVADDHELVRAGLRAVLEGQSGWQVCDEAANGQEAVEKAKQLKPDVVILDLSMPGVNGVEATSQIHNAVPETEVLILSIHESEPVVRAALKAGARGYVLKSDVGRVLVDAVQTLLDHKAFFSTAVCERMGRQLLADDSVGTELPRPPNELTSREREIMRLLADAKSNKEIAAALHISVKTVETHRSNMLHKLALHSTAGLVRYAVQNKIVDP